MNKYFAEMLGTFMLVFVGTGAVIINKITGSVTPVGIGLAFGLVVMVVIYSIGHISGAHINPAVTVAFALGGKFPRKDVIPYIAAQLAGATLASALLATLFGQIGDLGATNPYGSVTQSF